MVPVVLVITHRPHAKGPAGALHLMPACHTVERHAIQLLSMPREGAADAIRVAIAVIPRAPSVCATGIVQRAGMVASVEESSPSLRHGNAVLSVVARVREMPVSEGDTVAVVVASVIACGDKLLGIASFANVGRRHMAIDLHTLENPSGLVESVSGRHSSRCIARAS